MSDSASMTASMSSEMSKSMDEFKFFEENINYKSTPRPLLIVKIIFNTILILILGLSIGMVVQNSIN
jgi:hypothetical protein